MLNSYEISNQNLISHKIVKTLSEMTDGGMAVPL